MGVVYLNNFNDPFTEVGISSGKLEGFLLGFNPTLDLIGMGRLNVAANGGATAAFKYLTATLPDGQQAATTVTVTAPAPTRTDPVLSESLYGILPLGFLRNFENYTAELVFDLPHAEVGANGIQPTWSVAVNFKTGNTADLFGDRRPGAACQFSGSGAVTFDFTSYNGPAAPHNYIDFTGPGGENPTQFSLAVAIEQGLEEAIQGTGSLSYGKTTIPPHPLTPTGATFNELAVVGLALPTTTGGTYGVRLRTFTLSADARQR